jgi:two-component system, sensor histidine kinase and response regulator
MRWVACDAGPAALEELARAAAEGSPYDLVLLDERMPGMDGFTVVGSMQGDLRRKSSIILMLSGYDRVESVARCQQLGVDRYFVKPALPAELAASIALALGHGTTHRGSLASESTLAASGRELRILLGEDNPVNQKVAMTMLSKMGHHVTLATNGREVLEQWRSGPFDLILMDVQMPEISGLEATKIIREQERASGLHIPVVAMTASAMVEDRERCLAAGMDDLIAKPVSFRSIEQWISARFFESQTTARL